MKTKNIVFESVRIQVKADRESKNREGLSQASKAVNASTAQVVATAKNCAAIIEEKSIDIYNSSFRN